MGGKFRDKLLSVYKYLIDKFDQVNLDIFHILIAFLFFLVFFKNILEIF